ncbi:MAG: ASCH domain-containing protein [Candidatus Levybacteria bacterium]|nr:ASCH domain-containing protein [Candidatus Levybacteria bacterium]
MQNQTVSIGFASNLVPLILNGTKTLTYRLGDKYTFLHVGDKIAVRDSSTNTVFAEVEITEKSYTTFKDLPIDRVGHEIYPSKEKQRETFEKYYGTVKAGDQILILGFKLLKSY